eukprot:5503254-Alexandrium_andersonii.AAC.1
MPRVTHLIILPPASVTMPRVTMSDVRIWRSKSGFARRVMVLPGANLGVGPSKDIIKAVDDRAWGCRAHAGTHQPLPTVQWTLGLRMV